MTVTNEHIFKSAFNPAFPRQISKYYNHYEIGEFPPRLCLLNAIGQKNFITFESKMSLQFLWTSTDLSIILYREVLEENINLTSNLFQCLQVNTHLDNNKITKCSQCLYIILPFSPLWVVGVCKIKLDCSLIFTICFNFFERSRCYRKYHFSLEGGGVAEGARRVGASSDTAPTAPIASS